MAERTKSSIGTLALKACATAVLLPMSVLCIAAEGTESGASGEGKPLTEHQKEVTGASDTGADASADTGATTVQSEGGKPLTPHQQQVMKDFDPDNDGTWDKDEFAKWQEKNNSTAEFSSFDSDGDGLIDGAEFAVQDMSESGGSAATGADAGASPKTGADEMKEEAAGAAAPDADAP